MNSGTHWYLTPDQDEWARQILGLPPRTNDQEPDTPSPQQAPRAPGSRSEDE